MRAAVLGSPIEHSLSPDLHNAAYTAAGLAGWSYGRHRLEEADLRGFLAGLDADWRGLSLTMPLKRVCLEVADEASAVAQRAGAGNTLVRRADGGWNADNTDVGGLVDTLAPHWLPAWEGAAVLGAGATSRSALLALEELGASHAVVYARDPGRAGELSAWAERAGLELQVAVAPLSQWGLGDEPAVLSTLPPVPGMEQGLAGRGAGLLFDAVYADWPTPLARAGSAAGMDVVGGLDLLVHQAARQFELFTGVAAPVAAMMAAGLERLGRPAAGSDDSEGAQAVPGLTARTLPQQADEADLREGRAP